MHMAVLIAPTATATVGVAGSTGYAGRELLRLLAGHPLLRGVACTADTRALAECDLAMLALPHGATSELGRELAGARVPVVDLAADHRGEWVYGLPELHRERIAGAAEVANPGCYATAAMLALAPLVERGLVEPHLVVDGKSGVSGAGKKATERTHFCSAAEGIEPYSPVGHHHQLEIEEQLRSLAAGPLSVTFTPHLAPFSRGLLVTAYGRLTGPATQDELRELYAERYAGEPFVQLVDAPRTQVVRGANACHVSVWVDEERSVRDRRRRARQPGQGRRRPGDPEREPDARPRRGAGAPDRGAVAVISVVKVGGGAPGLVSALGSVRARGAGAVVVHGAGPRISDRCLAAGIEPRFVDGQRVTDPDVLEIVVAALAEEREALVRRLAEAGIESRGMADALDGEPVDDPRLGLVGRVVGVDGIGIRAVLAAGVVPVISPLAGGLNVNADLAASAVAASLGAGRAAVPVRRAGRARPGGQGDPADRRLRPAAPDRRRARHRRDDPQAAGRCRGPCAGRVARADRS